MQCPQCGDEIYGLMHQCRDASAAAAPAIDETPAPSGFAPGYYIRQGFEIARWDDFAIQRAMKDVAALGYGLAFLVIASALVLAGQLLMNPALLATIDNPIALIFGLAFGTGIQFVYMLVYYGLAHIIARVALGGRGSFGQVLRPLLLGSIVLWLAVIPYVGGVVANLWSMAVLMGVFEEVHRVRRLAAFAVAYGLGLAMFVLTMALLRPV